ncbi:MAG: SRPBCC family protein [Myxococcaceae bacterium]|nr:SRPBCC family protein [Myxococcaceae bacterium]
MLKKVLIGLVVVLVGLIGFIARRDSEFAIQRSTSINAPPDVVFAQVNDFHEWGAWSPWEKMDPNMKRTYSGTEAGIGAVYHWVGNDDVGEGEMKIVDAKAAERINIDLSFLKPFAAQNHTEFAFEPAGAATKTTWKMTGKNNFMAKAFGVFFDMDALVGADFDKGLASLKAVSEAVVAERLKEPADPADVPDAGLPVP